MEEAKSNWMAIEENDIIKTGNQWERKWTNTRKKNEWN